ncbi:MAG TPA: ATP-binding protein [Bacteroidota bacterium]
MRNPLIKSIRTRLTLVIMFISGLAVVLVFAGFLTYELVTFDELVVNDLGTKADILARNINAALAFRDSLDADRVLRSLASQPNIVSATVYDGEGALFAAYGRSENPAPFPPAPEQPGWEFSDDKLVLHRPVELGGSMIGTISITSDLAMRDARLRSYVQIAFGLLAGAFVVALLVTSRLASNIARPLISLADIAHRVSDTQDYSLRAPVLRGDETGVLAGAMNDMLKQIQRRQEQERMDQEEIRKLNEELEDRVRSRTAQLEAANKELEAFSYSVSHDLRAPLRHIDGFTQLLERDLGVTISPDAKRYLAVISESSKRLGQLIDDLLIFSRMGRSDLKASTFDMNGIVEEVVKELSSDLRSNKTTLETDSLPTVTGDRAMIRQVWMNLISNAVKYSRPKPDPRISVGWQEGDSDHVFFVRDNGVGFDMNYVGKLFGVFERLHRADEFEGTGIGLANVKRIVQRHGGRVWAEGEIDRGATFYFTIPKKGAFDAGPEENSSRRG